MDIQYKYRASASWAFHHRGLVEGEGVPERLEFSVPPEFGGEEHIWTPEHLLLAAVASCFVATFRGMAAKSNLEFESVEITVDGVIEKKEGSLRFTKLVLKPKAAIISEADRDRANRLLEKAEHGCLIARSLSAEIEMRPQVFVDVPLVV